MQYTNHINKYVIGIVTSHVVMHRNLFYEI